MVEVVEHLLCSIEALSSSPNLPLPSLPHQKKKKKETSSKFDQEEAVI
jgi:hypothetical protein